MKMNKIAIVTDTHLSVRNDHENLMQYQNEFWANVFFPKLKQDGIKEIFHLGDFFDKRQFVTVKSLQNLRDNFLPLLDKYDVNMTLIVGNHDILYRNTVEYNSPENIFANNSRINVIVEPTEIYGILLLPWITKDSYSDTLAVINQTDCKFCFGHFEIAGFEMHKGQVAESGMSSDLFDKFHKVLSGHFHTRSHKRNIYYVGSPFEMTWSDFNDPRGFHYFNTDSGDLEFIKNPESMFFKIEYFSKNGKVKAHWQPYKPDNISGKFLKIVVVTKESQADLDEFVSCLYQQNPSELQVYESKIDVNGVLVEFENSEKCQSNLDIIQDKIKVLEDLNKDDQILLSNYIHRIYNESASQT